MNICLISDRQIYKFVLNYEMNLKYIKKLCHKIFKTEDLDIYYKDKKIFEKYSEDTILEDIVNAHDSIIKFKIIFHSTFCNSKIQTPSTTNSQTPKTIDVGGIHNNKNKNKKIEIKSIINLKQNKLFEAVFTHKFKKLSSLMDEFNLKVIEMERFLFKKKDFSENNHAIFEKKIFQFVEGVTNYYQKLISILEKNNYLSYDEIVYNLRYFYNNIVFNEENEISKNIKENEQIMDYKTLKTLHTEDNLTINSSKNKFPINLKKSDKITTINAEKGNMFNKKSKKISIKDKLLSSEATDSKISYFNNKNKKDVFDIMEAKDTSSKIIINITDLKNKSIKKKLKFDELNIKRVDSEEKNNKKELKENLNIKTEKEEINIDKGEKIDKLVVSGDLFKKSCDSFKKIIDIKNKTNMSIKSVKSQKSEEAKKPKDDKKDKKNINNYNKNEINNKKNEINNKKNEINDNKNEINDNKNEINNKKNEINKKKNEFNDKKSEINNNKNEINNKKNEINNKKNEINNKKVQRNKINNIKTSIFKFEPNDENENENNSNSSDRSAKNMKTNYKNKLVFNSTIKESESEECSNRILDFNSSKNEEDNKSVGILDENEKKDKKRIDKLKKNFSKKKSLNPNILNIMKLSNKEDEIEDARKKYKQVTYHFSQKNLNFARTISKKLLKKKTKTNLQNKFDFII